MFNRRTSVNHELVCKAIPNLKKSGVLNDTCKFLELVSDGIFPLYNIYFLLFLTQSTCLQLKMPVDCDTEKRLRYFGCLGSCKMNKILQGWKFSGAVFEDKESKKYFNPQLTKPRINFAVPPDKIQKTLQEICKSTPFLEAWSYPLPFRPQIKQK